MVDLLSNVIEDLVRGEVMQLGHMEDREALFDQYLQKTFKKTASLMAYSCQAVGPALPMSRLSAHESCAYIAGCCVEWRT